MRRQAQIDWLGILVDDGSSPYKPQPHFDGPDVRPEDVPALAGQLARVLTVLKYYRGWDEWVTLSSLAVMADCSEASASARLRDLRKQRFGGWTVERRRVGNSRLFEYRLG